MTSKEFIQAVSMETGWPISDTQKFVEAMVNVIDSSCRAGEPFVVKGLGTFKPRIKLPDNTESHTYVMGKLASCVTSNGAVKLSFRSCKEFRDRFFS